jgi:hypothetical protein
MLIAKDVSSDSDSSSSGGLLGPPSSKKIRTPPTPFFERSMIERKATLVVKELVSVKDTLSHRLITMDMIQQLRERWPVPEVNLKKERISTPEKREKERLRSAARRAAKRAARDQLEAPSLVLEDEIDDNPPSLTQPTTESPNSSDSQNLTTDVPLSRLLRGGPTRSPG